MIQLTKLIQVERNARRLREIVTILGRYGLADWLRGIHFDWLQQHLRTHDGQKIADLSTPVRIRLALTELGTTFIKLGQVLSTRADLVGPELTEELQRLQSDTPPDPPDVVRQTIIAELGRTPEELFLTFEETPLGSASIGQVHRATLPDGSRVVVKVQHEGVIDTVTNDLQLLAGLAELAEQHAPQLRAYRPVALADEFRRLLTRELDFTREMRNMQQFTENFQRDHLIHVPKVYPDLCSRRVVTMELLDGIPLSDRERLEASGADLEEYAKRGADMYLDMIFRDGFYHADPHPGNLMLLKDNVIGLIDCGMVGRVDEQLRDDFEGMLMAAVAKNAADLTDYIVRLGDAPPDFDRNALQSDIGEFVADYVGASLKDFDLSGALNGMTEIIRRYQIQLPSSCSMLLRVLVMLEGTSRQLNPNFSLAELIEPYYIKAAHRKYSPQKLLLRAQRSFREWERLIDMFPRDASDILERVRRGRFDVNLQHRRLDAIINRLVCGILTAALFMGSAQLWSRATPPLIHGISIFGALGCIASGIFAGWLLLEIRRSGKVDSRDY